LPAEALATVAARSFGVYVHVPFCASRCGYCDFNTYTAEELGPGVRRADYPAQVISEIALAARVLEEPGPVDTVFFGGGTPTLLPPDDLARILDAVAASFGLASDAEITTEANPESVDPGSLTRLRAAGFNRISLGMQSAVGHVLRVLERRHTRDGAVVAARQAAAAGFRRVNLDLIYGTPGERPADWQRSLAEVATLVADGVVDHVSAYSLIVEDGTRLAARIRRGELPTPDPDVAADRYLVAERVLTGAGLDWYEVSNWAGGPDARCRHNLNYWSGGNWWGFGPGAHSHVGGVRWWNVKHPARYAEALAVGRSPGHGREVLTSAERHTEEVMLRLRLASGLPLALVHPSRRPAALGAVREGLLESDAHGRGRAVLTLRGRLLADGVVGDLLP
jgi:oxygen-independent coproporphyrinogen-3 oxidase